MKQSYVTCICTHKQTNTLDTAATSAAMATMMGDDGLVLRPTAKRNAGSQRPTSPQRAPAPKAMPQDHIIIKAVNRRFLQYACFTVVACCCCRERRTHLITSLVIASIYGPAHQDVRAICPAHQTNLRQQRCKFKAVICCYS